MLKDLFELENIKYVISVDDCFGDITNEQKRNQLYPIVKESFDTVSNVFVKLGKENQVNNIIALNEINLEQKDIEIKDLLNNLQPQELDICFNEIIPENKKSSEEQKSILDFLKYLKSSDLIDKYITVSSTHEAGELDLNSEGMNDGSVLWLIDKNFQNVGESEDAGIELAKNIVRKESDTDNHNNFVYILTSIDYQKEKEEDIASQFDEYLKESKTQVPSFIYYINKNRLNPDKLDKLSQSFAFGFKRKLCYGLIISYVECLRSACDYAIKDFQSLDQKTLNYVFAFKVQENGESWFDFFERLTKVYHENQYHNLLMKNQQQILSDIYHYQKLCNNIAENNGNEKDTENRLLQIRKMELYDLTVNQRHSEIASGDIFIHNNDYYILVTQPCDTYLRKDGKRKLDKAVLLSIANNSNAKYKYKLACFIDSNELYNIPSVLFQKSLSLPFEVLDLCVLNDDGSSSINTVLLDELSIMNYYSINYQERLKIIIDIIKGVVNNKSIVDDHIFNDGNHDIESIRKAYKDLIETDSFLSNFDMDKGRLKYPYRRIARLKDTYVVDLLKQYGDTLSRVGLPFGFLKNEKQLSDEELKD